MQIAFSISFSKIIESFDLIHVDIWGRYRHSSLDTAHYFYQLLMIIVEVFGFILWKQHMKAHITLQS